MPDYNRLQPTKLPSLVSVNMSKELLRQINPLAGNLPYKKR